MNMQQLARPAHALATMGEGSWSATGERYCWPVGLRTGRGICGYQCVGANAKVYEWKMITTWPKNLPDLGAAPERLAEHLRIMSNGRLDIKVYGAGELVGALEVFDAVSQGTAQMGHGGRLLLAR